jgi:hypothetical protein
VGITRRTLLERYSTRFAEAGVKVAAFTFSAPSIYSALRIFSTPPSQGFLALEESGDELEVYGESPARPIFSARVDRSAASACTLAIAELRLPPETEPAALHDNRWPRLRTMIFHALRWPTQRRWPERACCVRWP